MAPPRKINYRDIDKTNLRKAVSNFNRKLSRLSNKLSSDAFIYMPRKINAADLREMENKIIGADRKYYNQVVASLKRFTRPGAEKLITTKGGAVTTVWRRNEINYQLQSINQQRAARKRKSDANAKDRMGTIRDAENRPIRNKTNIIKPENFNEYARAIEQSLYSQNDYVSLERFKENYLKSIENNFGIGEFYRDIQRVNSLQLFNAAAGNQDAEIEFIYDSRISINDRIAVIKNELKSQGIIFQSEIRMESAE